MLGGHKEHCQQCIDLLSEHSQNLAKYICSSLQKKEKSFSFFVSARVSVGLQIAIKRQFHRGFTEFHYGQARRFGKGLQTQVSYWYAQKVASPKFHYALMDTRDFQGKPANPTNSTFFFFRLPFGQYGPVAALY